MMAVQVMRQSQSQRLHYKGKEPLLPTGNDCSPTVCVAAVYPCLPGSLLSSPCPCPPAPLTCPPAPSPSLYPYFHISTSLPLLFIFPIFLPLDYLYSLHFPVSLPSLPVSFPIHLCFPAYEPTSPHVLLFSLFSSLYLLACLPASITQDGYAFNKNTEY